MTSLCEQISAVNQLRDLLDLSPQGRKSKALSATLGDAVATLAQLRDERITRNANTLRLRRKRS